MKLVDFISTKIKMWDANASFLRKERPKVFRGLAIFLLVLALIMLGWISAIIYLNTWDVPLLDPSKTNSFKNPTKNFQDEFDHDGVHEALNDEESNVHIRSEDIDISNRDPSKADVVKNPSKNLDEHFDQDEVHEGLNDEDFNVDIRIEDIEFISLDTKTNEAEVKNLQDDSDDDGVLEALNDDKSDVQIRNEDADIFNLDEEEEKEVYLVIKNNDQVEKVNS